MYLMLTFVMIAFILHNTEVRFVGTESLKSLTHSDPHLPPLICHYSQLFLYKS